MAADEFNNSFADYPKSVGELKSDKTQDSSDWSPRDVLIHALREIDNGSIDPTALVLVIKPKSNDPEKPSSRTRFLVSSPDIHITLGLLPSAMIKMHQAE